MFIICILLAAGLLGCGGKESPVSSEQGSKQGPSKTYRESEIKLDKLQMVMNLALDSQDRLVMYDDEDRDSKFVILDKQGREIKQIPVREMLTKTVIITVVYSHWTAEAEYTSCSKSAYMINPNRRNPAN
ncbi:hypothetical protein [Syntrophomonas palmitatica]|uniref:hypothetical protein n=1 Tax=Syntrophomonas palmitatica TaxID=402877 RepID=UPI0012EDE915|nr:hypothetical protein [Syntrophomonas palmitatica]